MKKLMIMWVLPQTQEDCMTMTTEWLKEKEQEILKTVKGFFGDDVEIDKPVGTEESVPVDPDTFDLRKFRIDRMKNADILYFPEKYDKSKISKGEIEHAIENNMTFMTPDFVYYKTS